MMEMGCGDSDAKKDQEIKELKEMNDAKRDEIYGLKSELTIK